MNNLGGFEKGRIRAPTERNEHDTSQYTRPRITTKKRGTYNHVQVSRKKTCKMTDTHAHTSKVSVAIKIDLHGRRKRTVLEYASIGDVNPLPLIRHDDDGSSKSYVAPEVHVARNGQMVEFEDAWDHLEAFLELRDLYMRKGSLVDVFRSSGRSPRYGEAVNKTSGSLGRRPDECAKAPLEWYR